MCLCWNPVLWVKYVHATCNVSWCLVSRRHLSLVVSPTGLFQLRGVYCSRCTAAPVNSLLQGKEINRRVEDVPIELEYDNFNQIICSGSPLRCLVSSKHSSSCWKLNRIHLKPPVPVFVCVLDRWPSPLTFYWSLSMYVLRSTYLGSLNSCQCSGSPQLTCCYGDRHNCPHGLSAGYHYNMPMDWPGTALPPHDSSPWCNCLDNSCVFTWSSNNIK